MSKKASVGQDDLRRLMQKVKTGGAGAQTNEAKSAKLKKYKLGARELQLLEEQKRAKDEKRRAKEAQSAANALPQGFFDAKPAKSILKNSSSYKPPTSVVPQPSPSAPSSSSGVSGTLKSLKRSADSAPTEVKAAKKEKVQPKVEAPPVTEPAAGDSSELPEGFFDDPKLDAKARNQEYRDPKEEEWERFQKEISAELDTARELVSEEQQEATADRQIEEAEEQMRAWSKVSELEKKFDKVEEKVLEKRSQQPSGKDDSGDSSDEDDGSDLFNWRKKS